MPVSQPKNNEELVTVKIEKLVHGGQGLGILPDGRKVFVWNALPGEEVKVQLSRSKKSYAEGTALEVIAASESRVEPQEPNYLATSPWQIIDFADENHWKLEIVKELFQHAGIKLPKSGITTNNQQFHYRNKMEYSFWGDDDGIHLALYNRGSHQKQIVQGSALAMPSIDKAAQSLLPGLNNGVIRGGDLKTIIVRSDQKGNAVGALFVKRKDFLKLKLPPGFKGLRVYYSNPKSPASVPTELLQELGDVSLTDTLLRNNLHYDVDSFFQVNVPVFELALKSMKKFINEDNLLDMYAGVGSIGLNLAKKSVSLVELDTRTSAMAEINSEASGLMASVTQVASEKALDYITADIPVVFDPPRAGLHDKITDRILEILPPKILYLSCNPATHARDIAKLLPHYKIKHFEVFNFFPRTPHIETLAVMIKK